jgi:hypothetical protein
LGRCLVGGAGPDKEPTAKLRMPEYPNPGAEPHHRRDTVLDKWFSFNLLTEKFFFSSGLWHGEPEPEQCLVA